MPLCDACGGEDGPSCEEIWAVLALPGRSARERLAARAVELAAPALRQEVWVVASSWGSMLSGTDPGACMYGFGASGRPWDEEHRARCLRYIDRWCIPLLANPEYTQADARELLALRRYIETAEALNLEAPRKECP